MQYSLQIPENNGKLIISLYDYTGNWAKPYANAGYPVMLWDYKVEGDILEGFSSLMGDVDDAKEAYPGLDVYGILAAPPCTAFASSGACTWPEKDTQSERYRKWMPDKEYDVFTSFSDYMDCLTQIVLVAVEVFKPKFWVLENPVGRIEKRNPELKPYRKMSFNPCDYGDPYTKKTILWGDFNTDLKQTPVDPLPPYKSPLYSVPGNSKKAKEIRSTTPKGFCNAFYNANK